MRDTRALSWLLNWYRQSELEGALLLGRMVRHTEDPAVLAELTRHAADEARHAWLWQQTIARLQLAPVRIYRSYQSFYATEGLAPQRLAEVLALTHVFERRVDREFSEQLEDRDLPHAVHRTFSALLHDEQRHLDWIAAWLRERPQLEPLVARYSEVDSHVATALRPFRDRLWDVPGLGQELVAAAISSPVPVDARNRDRNSSGSAVDQRTSPTGPRAQRGGMAAKVRSMLSSTAKVERTPISR